MADCLVLRFIQNSTERSFCLPQLNAEKIAEADFNTDLIYVLHFCPDTFFLPSFVYLYYFSIMFSWGHRYLDDHMYTTPLACYTLPTIFHFFFFFALLISQESSQIPIQSTTSHFFIAFCSSGTHSPSRNLLSIIENITLQLFFLLCNYLKFFLSFSLYVLKLPQAICGWYLFHFNLCLSCHFLFEAHFAMELCYVYSHFSSLILLFYHSALGFLFYQIHNLIIFFPQHKTHL